MTTMVESSLLPSTRSGEDRDATHDLDEEVSAAAAYVRDETAGAGWIRRLG
jgi:hypothetical protein